MTHHILTLAIGIGLTTNLLLSEIFGLAAGGVVVPGYLALHLDRPIPLALTLGIAALTFGFVRALSTHTILYGRRRISIAILAGYVLSVAFAELVEPTVYHEMAARVEMLPAGPIAVIGYVIPGLIAVWFDRQGVRQTLLSMFIGASLVRLALIVVLGDGA